MGKYGAYLYEVNEIVNETLRIVEQIRIKQGKKTAKGYIVQSVVYPNAETYEISEINLKNGRGCAYVSGRRICPENSLWSVEHLQPYLNKAESLLVTRNSGKQIEVSCKECGTEKKMKADTLTRTGFSCNCTTGISYPELFTIGYLESKQIPYEYQYKFDNSRRRIDFKITIKGVTHFIEVHGLQHYKKQTSSSWENAHDKTKASDKIKGQWCKDNNYTLIELDCRESTFEFIRNSIEQCKYLPNITNDEVYQIVEYIQKNKRYDTKEIVRLYEIENLSTYQIGEMLNLSRDIVNDVLHKNNIELRDSGTPKRMIKCTTTGEIFSSVSDASRTFNIAQGDISSCANPNRPNKSAGKHPITGDKLHWEYVTEEN